MKGSTLENEYAYIKEGKVFLKGYLDMPDRQIGEVKNTEEEAFQYFINRYDIAVKKVDTLENEIEEAQNKGSYLTKLLQLRKRLLSFDGIGDFIPLLKKLDDKEAFLNSLIEENQKKNLEIKKSLLEEAKPFRESTDWGPSSDSLQEIRTKWIRTGPVEASLNDELEEEFKEILDHFYQSRKAFYEEQNRIIDVNKAKLEELLDLSRALRRRNDLDEAFEDMKRYQREWKEVGELPPKMSTFLFKKFRMYNSSFYEKYAAAKGIEVKRRVDPRVEAQMKMMKEAEKLSTAQNEEIFNAASRAKVLLNEWKRVRVPSHVADRNVAERFRSACDKIFELSYLMKVVSRKHPTFNFYTDEQKETNKYREMEIIVRRARADLEELVNNSQNAGNVGEDMERMMFNNLRTQKRKLLMKEIILEEIRQRVSR